MNKKLIIIALLTFYTFSGFAQSEIDNYKYVVIPRTYEFLKIPDKYQLNSLTKFLFEKYGFTTYWEDENFPADLIANPCLGLKADVLNDSNLFTSRLRVSLTDCSNKVVFTSEEGKSKEKDFKRSYHEALRRAFESVQKLNYHYRGGSSVPMTKLVPSTEVTSAETRVAEQEPANVESEPIEQHLKVLNPEVKKEQKYFAIPAVAEVKTAENKVETSNTMARSYRGEQISFFLIAQDNGYMVYVNESKVPNYKKGEMIGTLLKTSLPNVYRITWKNKEGKFEDTTGYFDKNGNLKIDFEQNGKIVVKIYKVEN